MTLKLFLKSLPYLLTIGALIFVVNIIHSDGYDKGMQAVQQKWDTDKETTRIEVAKLKTEYDLREQGHRLENTRVTHELAESQKNYELDISTLGSKYEHRLLLSKQRADSYKRQAEGGTAVCRDLASHTTRLDSSIEEGRSLVQELGTTIRLRDNQIISLGNQILNDRKLFSE